MSLKVRLVDADVFHPDDALQALDFEDGVHHQKRIAVRQNLLYSHDIQYHSHSPPRRNSRLWRSFMPGKLLIICEACLPRYAPWPRRSDFANPFTESR